MPRGSMRRSQISAANFTADRPGGRDIVKARPKNPSPPACRGQLLGAGASPVSTPFLACPTPTSRPNKRWAHALQCLMPFGISQHPYQKIQRVSQFHASTCRCLRTTLDEINSDILVLQHHMLERKHYLKDSFLGAKQQPVHQGPVSALRGFIICGPDKSADFLRQS